MSTFWETEGCQKNASLCHSFNGVHIGNNCFLKGVELLRTSSRKEISKEKNSYQLSYFLIIYFSSRIVCIGGHTVWETLIN